MNDGTLPSITNALFCFAASVCTCPLLAQLGFGDGELLTAAQRMHIFCGPGASSPELTMMINHPERKLLGFVDLDLGHKAVRVPVQAVDPLQESDTAAPLVSFECDGESCEFLVRGDASSQAVNESLQNAAVEALRLLSSKLLN